MKKTFLLLGTVLGLSACGGGSSSGSSADGTQASSETGIFLDSPVVNIGYKTETLESVTNASGEFEYLSGETVTFFIGDLELPPVTASNILTPLDIADTNDTSNNVVINIIRLLQSLDEDGDPTDGIEISDIAKANATPVDFTLSITDFASSSQVTNLVANSGSSNTSLISQEDALDHFEVTLAGLQTLSGTFNAVEYSVGMGSDYADLDSFIVKKTITFDGSGSCSFSGSLEQGVEANDSSAPSIVNGTPDTGNCTYSVARDGTLTINGNAGYAVSQDGNSIIGISRFSESRFAGTFVEVMVKAGDSLATSSLSGTFNAVEYSIGMGSDYADLDSFIVKKSITFDGSGSCSFSSSLEQGVEAKEASAPSIVNGTPNTGNCTYSVASDGTLTINGDTGYAVSLDGNSIIGISTFSVSGFAGTFFEIMVKAGDSFTTSSLSGTFNAVEYSIGMGSDYADLDSFIVKKTMTFDGSGSCSFSGSLEQGVEANDASAPSIVNGTPDTGNCTYSVASDGTLTINDNAGYAVSQDGNSIIGISTFSESGFAGTFVEVMVKK